MNQQYRNNIKLNGSVRFDIFDEKNNLKSSFQNHNKINQTGINVYKSILSQMMRSDFPANSTINDSQQVSILSNYVQLGGCSGDVQFLQPVVVKGKYKTIMQNAFYQEDTEDKTTVSNQKSMFINSDSKITLFSNPSKYGGWSDNNTDDRWCYVYKIGNEDTDFNELHTGLRIDIKGSKNKRNYFRIYYSYSDQQIDSYENIGRAVFPLVNGKPCYKQYPNYFGIQLMPDQNYSYFFDMYPRFCKIPKRISFVFQQNGTSNQATIQNIQFITHRTPKIGPICIYLKGTLNGQPYVYKTPIIKTKSTNDSIYYYARVLYKQAIGLNITKAGLCNSENNIVYEDQQDLNFNFGSRDYKYFFKERLASSEQCLNPLSQVDYVFNKTDKDRIDILYKVNVRFKLDSSSDSSNSNSSL